MMNNFYDEDYRNMLDHFRFSDFQTLLDAFGRNLAGRRCELHARALELLNSRPADINYVAYLSKIYEIYSFVQSDLHNNDMMCSYMQTQQRQMMSMSMCQMQTHQQTMYQQYPQHPQYPQQLMHMNRPGLPQFMTNRDVYGNHTCMNNIHGNTMANNNVHYVPDSYQPAGFHNVVSSQPPLNQQNMYSVIQNTLRLVLNASTGRSNNASVLSPQILASYKFKKLPFYDVFDEIITLTHLDGSERCTLPHVPRGTRECTFKRILTSEQASIISMNRDISYGKNDYLYQFQIRFCQLGLERNGEVTDYLPIGLHIRVNNKTCPLPPTAPRARPGTESRRAARPINCTLHIKLNPIIPNTVSVNWTPDGKKYAMAMFIVKKLSVDTLIKKLQDKEARSSEETKNYIIKKLADIDPDFATTSCHFSLICPLSKVRMKIPAKSVHCNHIQCFDASVFILMNEKKPTWMCPTCNKSCLYDDIQIENYFLEIVTSPTLQDDVKEIEILADGSWIISKENKDTNNLNSSIDTIVKPIDFVDLDDSDDEKSIEPRKEPRPRSPKCRGSENFKPHLVDLTIDEDEEPPKQKTKLGNEARVADAKQPVGKIELKPQAQVQPQQSVTSSEPGGVTQIDISSSPPGPSTITETS